MARWHRVAASGLVAGALSIVAPTVVAQRALEYEVKAAYLSHFLKFVEWPAESLGAPAAPFGICVLGTDPFGQVLDQTIGRETVAGHPIAVRRLKEPDESTGCRVVFLPGQQGARRVQTVLRSATAALVVGEAPRFLDDGGHINFLITGGHVRFDINFNSAKASGLIVSSKLARVARIAIGAPDGQR